MVHWRWSIYKRTDTQRSKYLRVRAIVVPDGCQDDRAGVRIRESLASFPAHLLSLSLMSLSLSLIPRNHTVIDPDCKVYYFHFCVCDIV